MKSILNNDDIDTLLTEIYENPQTMDSSINQQLDIADTNSKSAQVWQHYIFDKFGTSVSKLPTDLSINEGVVVEDDIQFTHVISILNILHHTLNDEETHTLDVRLNYVMRYIPNLLEIVSKRKSSISNFLPSLVVECLKSVDALILVLYVRLNEHQMIMGDDFDRYEGKNLLSTSLTSMLNGLNMSLDTSSTQPSCVLLPRHSLYHFSTNNDLQESTPSTTTGDNVSLVGINTTNQQSSNLSPSSEQYIANLEILLRESRQLQQNVCFNRTRGRRQSGKPLVDIKRLTIENRLAVMSHLLQCFNDNLVGYCRLVLDNYVRVLQRMFLFNESNSSTNTHKSKSSNLLSLPPSMMNELLFSSYLFVYNGFHLAGSQLVEFISKQCILSADPILLLMVQSVRTLIRNCPPPHGSGLSVSTASDVADQTASTVDDMHKLSSTSSCGPTSSCIAKHMITNASFRAKKIGEDIPKVLVMGEDGGGTFSPTPDSSPDVRCSNNKLNRKLPPPMSGLPNAVLDGKKVLSEMSSIQEVFGDESEESGTDSNVANAHVQGSTAATAPRGRFGRSRLVLGRGFHHIHNAQQLKSRLRVKLPHLRRKTNVVPPQPPPPSSSAHLDSILSDENNIGWTELGEMATTSGKCGGLGSLPQTSSPRGARNNIIHFSNLLNIPFENNSGSGGGGPTTTAAPNTVTTDQLVGGRSTTSRKSSSDSLSGGDHSGAPIIPLTLEQSNVVGGGVCNNQIAVSTAPPPPSQVNIASSSSIVTTNTTTTNSMMNNTNPASIHRKKDLMVANLQAKFSAVTTAASNKRRESLLANNHQSGGSNGSHHTSRSMLLRNAFNNKFHKLAAASSSSSTATTANSNNATPPQGGVHLSEMPIIKNESLSIRAVPNQIDHHFPRPTDLLAYCEEEEGEEVEECVGVGDVTTHDDVGSGGEHLNDIPEDLDDMKLQQLMIHFKNGNTVPSETVAIHSPESGTTIF